MKQSKAGTARRRAGWLIGVLIGMLVLASCGDTDDATGTDDVAGDADAAEPDQADPDDQDDADQDAADDSDDSDAADSGALDGDLSVSHGLPGSLDTYSVVGRMTNERLNAEGWDTEVVEFARTELNPQALAQNRTQFALIIGVESLRTFEAGGDDPTIRYVMENNHGEFVLIAKSEFPTCEDFDGIRFGVHGETSATSVAAMDYIREECGADPEVLVVPGGDNRIIALENDQLDATLVQLADWIELQRIAGEGAYGIVDSGDALIANGAASWWVNTEWLEENYDVGVAYMAEVLRTFRMIHDDPSLLEDAVREHVGLSEDEAVIRETVELYLDPDVVGLAPVDGGSTDTLQRLIEDSVAAGEVEPLDVDDLVHPTLLQDALDYLEEHS